MAEANPRRRSTGSTGEKAMQPTIQLQPGMTRQDAHPAARAAGLAKARLAYLDNLRVILTVLVVMVHAGVIYGSAGSFFGIADPGGDEVAPILLTIFGAICQSFFMGLFFFVSGCFIPGSLDRKGQAWFWKDRLLRLGVPLVVFSVFIAKVPMYFSRVLNDGLSLSFWEYSWQHLVSDLDAGPTWFLFALLVFSAGYSVWRLATRNAGLGRRAPPLPSQRAMLSTGLALGMVMFLACQAAPIGSEYRAFGFITLQFEYFPQYILMFVAGILASRGDWLARAPAGWLSTWRWVSLALVASLPVILVLGGAASGRFDAFATGLTWQCAAISLWMGLACVSFSLTLTLWLRERHNRPGALQAAVSACAYGAYIVHPAVLVPVTVALMPVALHTLAKFGLASALAVLGSFAIAAALRKLPGARSIL
jgi:hypothetical protein